MSKYAHRGKSLIRIAVVSLIFALVTPLAALALFGESTEYSPPMDPAAFYALSYEKQQEWLKDHSRKTTGLSELRNRVQDERFWVQEYFPAALSVFPLLFLSCAVIVAWERHDQ
jgi:hypothetical protein